MSARSAGDAAPGEPAPGAEIGPYRVVRALGRGGMGIVLEARHTRVGQRAAIKILAPERRATVGDAAVRRFLAEVDALSRLEHPGLVRILDCGDASEHGPWIAMEYVAGEVLRARLDRAGGAALPVADALRLVRRIASAVAAIHRAGIVHRDLKPDNVMVTPDDEVPGGERVKLLDFGIAKLVDGDGHHTTEGVVLGTAAYMAPEQCTGERGVDDRADVYALGVILFELSTGARPFAGTNAELMRQHVFAEPPLARVPDELRALTGALLAKEPSRRPAIDDVVRRLRALEAAAGAVPEAEPSLPLDETLPATPVRALATEPAAATGRGAASTLAPVVRAPAVPARRRPRTAWVVAGAVAAAAVGTIATVMLARSRSSRPPRVLAGMVLVPGARFELGSTDAELAAAFELPGCCQPEERAQLEREQPAHAVRVSTFQLDAREVTNREYARFLNAVNSSLRVRDDSDEHYPRFVVEAASDLLLLDLYRTGGIVRKADKTPGEQYEAKPGLDDAPVALVTWDGASRYCHSLGKRLPTEAEWELAARGRERRRFPWGAEPPRCDGVVFGRGEPRGCPGLPATTAATGSAAQDVTPSGVHDLGGNVGEWVQDQFVGPAYADCGDCRDPIARDDSVALADDFRMFRGGTFRTLAWGSRASTRSRFRRTSVLNGLGFRCAYRQP